MDSGQNPQPSLTWSIGGQMEWVSPHFVRLKGETDAVERQTRVDRGGHHHGGRSRNRGSHPGGSLRRRRNDRQRAGRAVRRQGPVPRRVFGVGDATALLKDKPGFDYLEDLEGNSDPEVVEVITDITDRIETAKPGLLDSTVDELRSGDPYLVQSAVDDINLVLGVTLEEMAAEYEDDPGAVTPLALVAVLGPVFHVGAVVTGAVVVAIVAAVVTVGAFWSRSAGAEQQREQGIADLTAALAQ
jgi:SdpC family antimicrobial peptide